MEKNKDIKDRQTSPTKIEDYEIDLIDLFNIIWKRKFFLIVFVFVITSSVTIYSLILPNIYRAKVVILPTKPPSTDKISIYLGNSSFGKISSGISIPAFYNEEEIKAILYSRIFYKQLIKKYNLMPILFFEKWDKEQKKWKNLKNPPTIDEGVRFFKSIVKISEDKKKDTITIIVEFKDPKYAARLAELIIKELKNIIIKNTIQRAKKTLKELKKNLYSTTDPLIQQAIYPLIANQILTISLAKVSEVFPFKIIDPIQVTKYKPKRARMIVAAFIASLFLGMFLIFFKEYIDNVRKNSEKEKNKC